MNGKDSKGKFAKGNGGRKKGSKNKRNKSLTNLLEASLHDKVSVKDKDGNITAIEFGEAMISTLKQLILNPDISPYLKFNAIQWYFNRLEGTPIQVIRQDTSNVAQAFDILRDFENKIIEADSIEVIEGVNDTNKKTN